MNSYKKSINGKSNREVFYEMTLHSDSGCNISLVVCFRLVTKVWSIIISWRKIDFLTVSWNTIINIQLVRPAYLSFCFNFLVDFEEAKVIIKINVRLDEENMDDLIFYWEAIVIL